MTLGALELLWTVFRRDVRVAFRRRVDLVQPALFFVLVTALFPLALNPKAEFLRALAPGVIWIAALLATLLSLNLLYRADVEDGTMEQMVLQPYPLALVMLAKTAAHWTVTGVPVLVMAPVLAMTYHLPGSATGTLLYALLLGTPALSLLGSVGAALTAGLRQAGTLLALMVIPLMLPVLILGARATDMALAGEPVTGPLYLMGALLALALGLAPLASAVAIRISMD